MVQCPGVSIMFCAAAAKTPGRLARIFGSTVLVALPVLCSDPRRRQDCSWRLAGESRTAGQAGQRRINSQYGGDGEPLLVIGSRRRHPCCAVRSICSEVGAGADETGGGATRMGRDPTGSDHRRTPRSRRRSKLMPPDPLYSMPPASVVT
jgi:hypothetical protein